MVRGPVRGGDYDLASMPRPTELRRLRVLLAIVAFLAAWPFGTAHAAPPDVPASTECLFTKVQAIEAHGGPLGPAIWGRLCQLDETGTETFAPEVTITVEQAGETVGSAVTDDGGVFVVPIPGNGVYSVTLDTETLPEGFSLTDDRRATLDGVRVNLGDQQVTFSMGASRVVGRSAGDYLTTMVKGLRLGLILAVAAVGLSLVYSVSALVNFAHAELVSTGAVIAFAFTAIGIPFWLAVICALGVGGVLGALNDLAIWRPLARYRMVPLSMMVVSIGIGIAGRNLLQLLFGANGRRYAAATKQRERSYGPIRLAPNDLWIMLICVVALGLVIYLLRRSRLGTAIRAVADNQDLASSSGIAVERIVTAVWVLCGMLATLAGVLYGLMLNVKFDMGFTLLLAMFAAVVLGGLGSAAGAMIGAIIIGVVQETSGMFIDTAYKFVVALAVLIIVLMVRPQGILGKRERFG